MKTFISLFLSFILSISVFAQELNCHVRINYAKAQTTNTQIFQQLQEDITKFMNNTRWTNYVFAPEERINCDILIIIDKFNGTDFFQGSIQVSSNRPVYGSSYTTPVLNIREKSGWLQFHYIPTQPIEFNEHSFTGDLAYTLAYYAYLIIGFDFDTFSENGGQQFFEKLKNIVSNAQSSPSPVWRAMGTNHYDNRYYITKDLNDDACQLFHDALYQYHRQGLDYMYTDLNKGRQGVLNALKDIEKLYQQNPECFLVKMFLDTKRQELINIFSLAPMTEAKEAARILKEIDPSNADKYDKLGSQTGQ